MLQMPLILSCQAGLFVLFRVCDYSVPQDEEKMAWVPQRALYPCCEVVAPFGIVVLLTQNTLKWHPGFAASPCVGGALKSVFLLRCGERPRRMLT